MSTVSFGGGEFKRHSEFWFIDGSVVLVAKDVMFRVHKTFLARKSEVFQDMFALAVPTTLGMDEKGKAKGGGLAMDAPSESQIIEVDGCPVVFLHGDSAEDVANLLYALYDGSKFGDNDRDDFRVVSGILRLATKYVVDSLRTEALEHLSKAWPSTLKGWDAREEAVGGSYGTLEEPRFYPNPVEVINLAREVNAPHLLPSAFYDLSRCGLSEIFDHSLDMLDTDADTDASSTTGVSPAVSHQLNTLSLADTQRLVLGREGMHCVVTALIRSLAAEARSNPANVYASQPHAAHAAHPGFGLVGRGFAVSTVAHGRHRRADSGAPYAGRCSSPAACWRDVSELVDLATQHYLFDRERGAADPLYVAEELALLKGAGDPELGAAGNSSGSGGFGAGSGGSGRRHARDEDDEDGSCRSCARHFEIWAKKERERIWRNIPAWFRLDS